MEIILTSQLRTVVLRFPVLPKSLLKVADYLESEFDSFTQKFMSLLEPAIIVIMGVMVGLIVLSIMLPIMQLNNLVLM